MSVIEFVAVCFTIFVAFKVLQAVLQKYKSQRPYIAKSSIAGSGVFASRQYSRGDLVDTCPTIATPRDDIMGKNRLQDYVFNSSTEENADVLVPLGNCGIFNHSDNNNATYRINDDGTINVYALKRIGENEEITINYSKSYWESRSITPK